MRSSASDASSAPPAGTRWTTSTRRAKSEFLFVMFSDRNSVKGFHVEARTAARLCERGRVRLPALARSKRLYYYKSALVLRLFSVFSFSCFSSSSFFLVVLVLQIFVPSPVFRGLSSIFSSHRYSDQCTDVKIRGWFIWDGLNLIDTPLTH